MFHSAKALVLWKGYRERNHWCLLIAVRELLVRTGELDEDLADDLELSMGVRHGADYALEYDDKTAGRVVGTAMSMLETARALLDRGRGGGCALPREREGRRSWMRAISILPPHPGDRRSDHGPGPVELQCVTYL